MFVDDGHQRNVLSIAARKVASGEERHSNGLEIAGRYSAPTHRFRPRAAGVINLLASNPNSASSPRVESGKVLARGDGLNPIQFSRAFQQRSVEGATVVVLQL